MFPGRTPFTNPMMPNSMGQNPMMGQNTMGQNPMMSNSMMGQTPFMMGQNPMMPNSMGQNPMMGQNTMGQNPMMGNFAMMGSTTQNTGSQGPTAMGQNPMMGGMGMSGGYKSFEDARARKMESEEKLKRENPEEYEKYMEQQKKDYTQRREEKQVLAKEVDRINNEYSQIRKELTQFPSYEGWPQKVEIVKRWAPSVRLDITHINLLLGMDYFGYKGNGENTYTTYGCDQYRLEILFHLYEGCTDKLNYAPMLATGLYNQKAKDELHEFVKNPGKHVCFSNRSHSSPTNSHNNHHNDHHHPHNADHHYPHHHHNNQHCHDSHCHNSQHQHCHDPHCNNHHN